MDFYFIPPLAGGVESFGNIRKTGPCFSGPPPGGWGGNFGKYSKVCTRFFGPPLENGGDGRGCEVQNDFVQEFLDFYPPWRVGRRNWWTFIGLKNVVENDPPRQSGDNGAGVTMDPK